MRFPGLFVFAIVFGSVFVGSSHVFAGNDCSMVRSKMSDNPYRLGFQNIFNDEEVKRAFLNLKAYCCFQNFLVEECKQDEDFFDENAPQSPFLYDHLIDIMIRKLDANDYFYGLEPYDLKGEKRREYLNEKIGGSSDPNSPLAMETRFAEYWNQENPQYTLAFNDWGKIWQYQDDYLLQVDEKYQNANLYQRYQEVCGIAAKLYFRFSQNSDENNNYLIENAYNSCKKLVNKRIVSEYFYVKTLMIQKSSSLLQKSLTSYLDSYFNQQRLINLQETITSISTLFMTVAQNFAGGTAECN